MNESTCQVLNTIRKLKLSTQIRSFYHTRPQQQGVRFPLTSIKALRILFGT